MDILILNWKDVKNPEVGGAEIIAFEFARRLVKDGHNVVFFCRTFQGCLPEEEIDGVKIIRRGNKFTVYLHAFFYYLQLKKKPDRVIDMVNTIIWQTPLYVDYGRRVVYVNQLAKEVFFYEFPWPLSTIAYFLERFEYLPYLRTKFLCYSKSTKEDLISFGISSHLIRVFPLGLDHNRYKKEGKKTKDPLFIFVARLVKMKRADLCIEAISQLRKEFPKVKLAIIGNGPEEIKLKMLVRQKKLENYIEFVDKNNFFIDKNIHDIKVYYMQKAWALLLPSVKEGWGMVVTEAAACGTPAIVSNVTGLRDSVLHNKTGIILSKDPTCQELSKAMLRIIEERGLREKLGKGAIAWSKKFSWESSYEAFKKLL